MNCAEFEKLVDSYLDGELSGSLRLEFDAHRLRCRRCQLTMVMMESVGNVVAADRPAPSLPDDFTERVMSAVEQRRPLSVRLRSTRVAVVAGAVLQAAAVIWLAIWLPWQPATPVDATEDATVPSLVANATDLDALDAEYAEADAKFALREALYDDIVGRFEAAGGIWTSDLNQVARYVSAWSVPDGAMDGMVESNPWDGFLRAIMPPAESEGVEAPPAATDQYSL